MSEAGNKFTIDIDPDEVFGLSSSTYTVGQRDESVDQSAISGAGDEWTPEAQAEEAFGEPSLTGVGSKGDEHGSLNGGEVLESAGLNSDEDAGENLTDGSDPPPIGGAAQRLKEPDGPLSAHDIMLQSFPEPEWLIPNLIPSGCIVLGARPKLGKSLLAMQISLGVALCRPVLSDESLKRGRVLFVMAEGSYRLCQQRLGLMLQGDDPPRHLTFEKHIGTGDEAVQYVRRWIQDHPDARLIVLDTLHLISRHKSGNDAYKTSYDAAEQWAKLSAEFGVSILMITHLRKGKSSDPLQSLTGGMGLPAAVDTVVVMKPAGAGRCRLHIESRTTAPSDIVIERDDRTLLWSNEGLTRHRQVSDTRQRIVDALKSANGESLTPKQISERLPDLKDGNVRAALSRMMDSGDAPITKSDYGEYKFDPR